MTRASSEIARRVERGRAAAAVLLATAGIACGGSNGAANDGDDVGCSAPGRDTSYDPPVNAADFTTTIDNKYFPLVPGTVFKYSAGKEDIEVTVTTDTRMIAGIKAVVVRDTVKLKAIPENGMYGGMVFEDTWDWYAQDKAGNVWYMGEDTKEYPPGGPVSTAGSWETGRDCAKPGIVMKANPQVGDKYRQEYHAGNAEDWGEVVALGEKVMVPAGMYDGCVKTKDTSALEPGKFEHKYYCPGVGNVLAEAPLAVGVDREELISVQKK